MRSRWQDTRVRKLVRDLRLHASRTALVILAMVAGLAGAGAVLDTWTLMRQVTREEYRASRPASATLRVDGVDGTALRAARARPEIAAVQARRTVTGTVRRSRGAGGSASGQTLVLYALDQFADNAIGHIEAQQGDWPPRDGAIVVEHSSVEFGGLAPGDTAEVRLGDRTARVVAVTGIARDVGLPPGWMEHVVYAFATPATLAQLGAPSTFDELQFVVRDLSLSQDSVRRVAFALRRDLERLGVRVLNVDVPVPGEHQHAAQINSLLYTQGAFGLLALLCSSVLVVNLIAAMLVGQVREIGVMKAMGASPTQIGTMYIAMAFVLGLVACAIAIPLAAVIGRAYADFTAEILNFSTAGFRIPMVAFLAQVAVGLTFPVLAASVPVARGCRISVAEALRDVGVSAPQSRLADVGVVTRLASQGGVRRPVLFSLRNAFRRKQRLLLTLTTLALGGGVFMGARNLQTAVRGAVDLTFGSQHYDLGLRLTRDVPVDSIERVLAGVAGIERTEAWGAFRATVQRADSTQGNAFPVSVVPRATTLLEPRLSSGRWFADGDSSAIVINRRLAIEQPVLHVGAVVALVVNGVERPWTVIGVSASGTGPQAYAPRMARQSVDRVVVRTSSRSAPMQLDLMQRLRSALADAQMPVQQGQLMSDARAAIEDHLLMVASFLGVMGQLMIIVGGLALASTMGMTVLERTREIGVLRAIGAPHRAIFSIVQVEGLTIALLGWALGIPLSVPMSVMLGRAFSRIMLPVEVSYLPDVRGVAVWFAVALVVSVVACALPARRAMRIPTRAALAYE